MIRLHNRWLKLIMAIIGICVLVSSCLTHVNAENSLSDLISVTDYLERGIRAAYHNMHLLFEAYYNKEGNLQKQIAGHVAIEQKWDGDVLVSRTYLDANGNPMNRIDGYARVAWIDSGRVKYYNKDGSEVSINGLNLTKDAIIYSDGWSEWMAPEYDVENCIINIGNFNLGDSMEGDEFTLSVTIEFRNVTSTTGESFAFRTAGSVNNVWDKWSEKNPWNFSYIDVNSVPTDGVYIFTKTISKTNGMSESSKCNMGFRCDFWNSGAFRIRDLKVEKGNTATEWSPGL